MKKKIRITFLLDKKNIWFRSYFSLNEIKNFKKYKFDVKDDVTKIKNTDIIITIGIAKKFHRVF